MDMEKLTFINNKSTLILTKIFDANYTSVIVTQSMRTRKIKF